MQWSIVDILRFTAGDETFTCHGLTPDYETATNPESTLLYIDEGTVERGEHRITTYTGLLNNVPWEAFEWLVSRVQVVEAGNPRGGAALDAFRLETWGLVRFQPPNSALLEKEERYGYLERTLHRAVLTQQLVSLHSRKAVLRWLALPGEDGRVLTRVLDSPAPAVTS